MDRVLKAMMIGHRWLRRVCQCGEGLLPTPGQQGQEVRGRVQCQPLV